MWWIKWYDKRPGTKNSKSQWSGIWVLPNTEAYISFQV